MRKEIANKLKDRLLYFAKQSGVELIPDSGASLVPKGAVLYVVPTSGRPVFFILVVPNPKYDCFSVEIAGSETGEWPAYLGPISKPDGSLQNGMFRFPLALLKSSPQLAMSSWWIGKPPSPETPWQIPTSQVSMEIALSRIDAAAADVICMIKVDGYNYFTMICKTFNVNLLPNRMQ